MDHLPEDVLTRILICSSILLALVACDDDPVPPPPAPKTRHYVFRAISGISMGGIGAAAVGPRHPEKFDVIAAMGGPLDAAYMLGSIERLLSQGFCSYERLSQAALDQVDLNDPDAFTDCMGPLPPGDPDGFEHAQYFNKFQFTKDGGTFDRSAYMEIFEDLSLAFGNAMYYNPESSLLPHPLITRAKLATLCSGSKTPVRIPGLLNKEHNPHGAYDAIAFCDGEDDAWMCRDTKRVVDLCAHPDPQTDCGTEGGAIRPRHDDSSLAGRAVYFDQNGRFDPCQEHREPITFALAIDFNGNGKRDFAEPVIANGHERWRDVGPDGCESRLENGSGGCVANPAQSPFASGNKDPNGDDAHFDTNPRGTERNRRFDAGEPYEDCGLDGVCIGDASSEDYGEGNARYDDGPNRANFFANDARSNFAAWPEEQRHRVDFYIEGGIRDVFNLGVSAGEALGGVRAFLPAETGIYADWLTLPTINGTWAGAFNWEEVAWTQLPRNIVIRYGNRNASQADIFAGDGDHVGGGTALNRMATFYFMLGEKWAFLGKGRIEGAPPFPYESTFPSAALGADRDFAIAFPPGYTEETGRRYPVAYMGHGYGMDPVGMAGFSFISSAEMQVGKMTPMIFVFPNGRCCYRNTAGDRKCTERPDVTRAEGPGNLTWDKMGQGYKRECLKGTFYVDGRATGNNGAYEKAYLELMDYVDANFRTLAPRDVPLP